MTSAKMRAGALASLALSMLLIAGCERGAASDPLAATTGAQNAAPQESPTPTTGSSVVVQVSPSATATGLPAVISTPTQPALAQTTPTASPTVTSTPVPGGGTTYTVKAGDRLFSIGRQFGVNPYSIAQANNIQPPYIIYPGQVLKIPTGGGTVTPPPGGKTHTVGPGENLFRISLRYGTTVHAIAAANPSITNINLIFIGQVLKIP
jgi:LysM repeat protein